MARSLSDDGAAFIEQWEGSVDHWYRDQGGSWQIGIGHLRRGDEFADVATEDDLSSGRRLQQAEIFDLFRADAEPVVATVDRLVTVGLTQRRFDALVDFAFNWGIGDTSGFPATSVLGLVNAGEWKAVARDLVEGHGPTGRPYDKGFSGVRDRRAAEAAAFLMTPVEIILAVVDDLRALGIPVQFVDGWEDRGRPYLFQPEGAVDHHTATWGYDYDYPSLGIVRDGRSDLPGPLAQFGIGRITGTLYVVAGGYCLEAGATVLTRRGIVPIESVTVADEVWTHRSRWRRVTAVSQTKRPAVRLTGFGHPGIVCSPDHRWFSVPQRPRASKRLQRADWERTAPVVGEASDMLDRLWLSPGSFAEDAMAPDVEGWEVTPELMRVAGAYVADGTMGTDWQPKITPRVAKAVMVEGWLDAAGLRWHRRSDHDGTARIGVGSAALGRWLVGNFGRKSVHRTLPAWLLCGPSKFAEAFLDGYLYGDGHRRGATRGRQPLIDVTTSSRALAFGVRMLAHKVGLYSYVTSVRDPGEITIKGKKTAATAPNWTVIVRAERPQNASGMEHQGWWGGRVRSVTPVEAQVLYDLTVDEDESFIVDGLLTHNCNHAGGGGWNGLSGNGSVWAASEAENDGIGEPISPLQTRTRLHLHASLCRHTDYGPEMISCHREWSDGGKIDPTSVDGDWLRASVAELLKPQPPAPLPAPKEVPELFIADGPDGGIYYTDGATWKRGLPNANALRPWQQGHVPHIGTLDRDYFDSLEDFNPGRFNTGDPAGFLQGPLSQYADQVVEPADQLADP